METIIQITILDLLLMMLCGFLYTFFNELEDKSVRDGWKRYKQFLNKKLSWKNKWKLDKNGNQILSAKTHWYYFGVDPKYKERFYLSSTILVFISDGEHVFQFMKNRAIEIGFLMISWQYVIAWIIGKSLMQIIKEKFLDWLN